MLIAVITSTTREGRFSQRVAEWVVDRLTAWHPFDVEHVDLRDYDIPYFDGPAPARIPRTYATPDHERLGEVIDRADGYIVLTAEYNHGYPAILKSAMDSTFVEWHRKPISFVGWGQVGGARAVEQLRTVAVEFEMAPLRHAVHVLPDVMMAARQADGLEVFASLDGRLEKLAGDLAWWATALGDARARDVGSDSAA